MLRGSAVLRHYRAAVELDRIRGMLLGRARLERKIGMRKTLFILRTQTRYRVEQRSYWCRAITRKNVDSAAHEHGSAWVYLRNDLARQNVMLLPRAQQTLAQYEPLAFRAVVELCASRVPPPPPPLAAQVPETVYALQPYANASAHPSARRELREGVTRMLRSGHSTALVVGGPATVDGWMDAWREYDVAAEDAAVSSNNSGSDNRHHAAAAHAPA